MWRAALAAGAILGLCSPGSAQKHLGILENGQPTCVDGVWTEHPEQDVIDAVFTPDVQCWRNPPSIRTSYLSAEKCARWPNDDDWPTWSPHHTVTPATKRAGDLLRDFLRGKNVIFVGDSINSLVVSSFLCDAAREGFPQIPHGKLPQASDEVKTRLHAYKEVAWNAGVDWVAGPPQEPQILSTVDTLVARKGWHHYGHDDMRGLMSAADVLVVNYALHYSDFDMAEYEREMRRMFEQVGEFARTPGKAFVFRETAAEHKHSYVDAEELLLPEDERYLGCRCRLQELKDKSIVARNEIIARLVKEFPYVRLAPFYDMTRGAADMHEGAWCTWSVVQAEKDHPRPPNEKEPYCCDCTHYGYYPQLWANFWDGLYRALAEAPGMPKPEGARARGS